MIFWCCIFWLLKYIVFFHRRSYQPRVHRLVVVHSVVAKRNDVDQCIVVGGQDSTPITPKLVILQQRWHWYDNTLVIALVIVLVIVVTKQLLSSYSLKSYVFSSWNCIMRSSFVMRCSFWFDICVCDCYDEGEVKYCDGW